MIFSKYISVCDILLIVKTYLMFYTCNAVNNNINNNFMRNIIKEYKITEIWIFPPSLPSILTVITNGLSTTDIL